MKHSLRPVPVCFLLLTPTTGIVCQFALTAVGQPVISRQANGSMIENNGKTGGSALIGEQCVML